MNDATAFLVGETCGPVIIKVSLGSTGTPYPPLDVGKATLAPSEVILTKPDVELLRFCSKYWLTGLSAVRVTLLADELALARYVFPIG